MIVFTIVMSMHAFGVDGAHSTKVKPGEAKVGPTIAAYLERVKRDRQALVPSRILNNSRLLERLQQPRQRPSKLLRNDGTVNLGAFDKSIEQRISEIDFFLSAEGKLQSKMKELERRGREQADRVVLSDFSPQQKAAYDEIFTQTVGIFDVCKNKTVDCSPSPSGKPQFFSEDQFYAAMAKLYKSAQSSCAFTKDATGWHTKVAEIRSENRDVVGEAGLTKWEKGALGLQDSVREGLKDWKIQDYDHWIILNQLALSFGSICGDEEWSSVLLHKNSDDKNQQLSEGDQLAAAPSPASGKPASVGATSDDTNRTSAHSADDEKNN